MSAGAPADPAPLESVYRRPGPGRAPLSLSPEAALAIRTEVLRAGGREVCFLAEVRPDGVVEGPRAVARGNMEAVLAASRDAPEGGVMIHNHPSGLLEPSDADLAVAARLYERGLGTAISDNDATALYVVVEPPEPRRREPLDVAALEDVLAPGGVLAALSPPGVYEDRPGQRRMMRLVAERYHEGGVSIVEAGTGTGKSLAYLVPAAAWAARNGERTVVSTNTINLQEQLTGKDLPLVRRLLGDGVRWALVKGRGNYVSIRRARLAAESAPSLFDTDRSDELASLLAWVEATEDGSLSDLPFQPSEEAWEEVRSDADICLRARCPHFQECFYQRSRRRAASADLLVVNHHLLFTDLAVRRTTANFTDAAVLPAYRRVVLDEAHNLEDAATSHLGAEVTRRGLFRLLARLERGGKGVLAALDERLAAGPGGSEHRARLSERVRPVLDEGRSALVRFYDALEPTLPAGRGEPHRIGGAGLPEPVERTEVREALDALLAGLGRLEREVAELRVRLELDGMWAEALEGRVLDLQAAERRLAAAARGLRLVLDPGEGAAPFVRWVEWRGAAEAGKENLVLAAAPVEPGPMLRESLFRKAETVVLTSATLTTRRSFEFLRRRLGLDPAELEAEGEGPTVTEAVLDSPFDFRAQTLLCVPTDLPDPRTADEELQRETARVVRSLASLTGGGLFALFTSHRALRRVAELLRGGGEGGRWPLFVHGEGDRHRLLRDFVRSGDGILLGTASFWEGVDVPGRPLRGMVLQKLPFRVPTEPVVAARLEAIEQAGGSAFWSYMLPLAALRLKQGFGRLVRSRGDRGAVVLLDDRIVTRRYGRYLRESLPEAPFVKGPWSDVERALRRFYAGEPLSPVAAPLD